MRRVAAGALLVAILTVSTLTACGGDERSATHLDADDRAVYAAVLGCEEVRGDNDAGREVRQLVVVAETDADDGFGWLVLRLDGDVEPEPWFVEAAPDPTAIRAFVGNALDTVPLPQLEADLPVVMLDPEEFAALIRRDDWPLVFWEAYPESTGFIRLTRIGYSEDRTSAITAMGSTQGGLSGGGFVVGLEKTADGWAVAWTHPTWVS